MTLAEAKRATTYFAAGVYVEIWCYSGTGNWAISIRREAGYVRFYDLDSLKRSVFALAKRISESREDLELWPDRADSYDDRVEFYSVEDAKECVAEIHRALQYVQTVSPEDCWHEVPATLFEDFAAAPVVMESTT